MTTKEINRAVARRLPWISDLVDVDELSGRIVIRRMTAETLEIEPDHTWGTGMSQYERMVTVTLHDRGGSLLGTVESGEQDMGSGSYKEGEAIVDACGALEEPAAVYWIARVDDTRDGRKDERDVYLDLWKPMKEEHGTLTTLLEQRAEAADGLIEGYVEAPATDDELTSPNHPAAIARGRSAWWKREAAVRGEHGEDPAEVQTALIAEQIWAAAAATLEAVAASKNQQLS